MPPVETIIEAIIGFIFGTTMGIMIVRTVFSIKNMITRRQQRRTAEWTYLSPYVYRTALRRNTRGQWEAPTAGWDPRTEEVYDLMNAWLKVRGLTPEQKKLALQAGYSPEQAREAYKTLGADGLQAQIYLTRESLKI